MPEPQDHVFEQERSTDTARPREADQPRESRIQPTDLQARLERLPVGHPSSPYRDDGSRKSPPPDLAKYELPHPDELPPDSGPADRELTRYDEARVTADGSWEWRGRHLTPDQSRIADQALAKCREAEGRDTNGNYGDHDLTPAMRRIEAQLDHGHLVEGIEKSALKEPSRFKEKLADMIKDEPDKPAEQHADEIHDGIRYTFIFEPDDYVSAVNRATDKLEGHGFELGIRKNTWGNDEYKGVNTRWRDGDSGRRFEVQFHTEASWQAKQATHDAYVRINDIRTSTAERERLRAHQCEVSARVMPPAGWEDITDYRKEGW
jgi:hypothetical protein